MILNYEKSKENLPSIFETDAENLQLLINKILAKRNWNYDMIKNSLIGEWTRKFTGIILNRLFYEKIDLEISKINLNF